MRKKLTFKILIIVFAFTFFTLKVNAANEIMGETLVYKYSKIEDLPSQFVKDSDFPTYEYAGEVIYDFRNYFEVYDNAETILNMYDKDEPKDEGGYVWDTNFDIGVTGIYDITLSYEGVTGYKEETITLEVIETDEEAPTIFMIDRVFNKTRLEKPEDFNREFETFLRFIRVYDKVDGIIEVTKANFPEDKIEELRNADLRSSVEITLEITDKAGNVSSSTAILNVVDSKAPNIQNVKTITTKKGRRINYTKHLKFTDNYSDDINRNYEVYETLIMTNIWTVAARRPSQSEGVEIKSYIRLEDTLATFINYLELEYRSTYLVDDYFEIIDEDEKSNYFYIESKEITIEDDKEVGINVWKLTTDKTKVKGKMLNRYHVTNLTKTELENYVNTEHEVGYSENDYYEVLDLVEKEKYFIYISEKLEVLTDSIDTINFNKVGVSYVRVTATDEFGNTAIASYRVVVENGIGLFMSVLIVNGIVLALAGVSIGAFLILKRRK